MRVLFLTQRLPYAPNRGDRIRSHHMLRYLAGQRGINVDLLSLVHDRDEAAHVNEMPHLTDRVRIASVSRVGGAWRAARALVSGGTLTHALLDSRRVRPLLRELVAERRPDVVLAYCSSMARYALEPPLSGIPLVIDMVDADSAKWAALAKGADPIRALLYRREAVRLRAFEAAAMRRARATLVVSERERELLAAVAPDARLEVIWNGVASAWFAPVRSTERRPHVVFCGVFSYEPNARAAAWLATEVWPIVRRRRGDARLVLLGASPPRSLRLLATRDKSIEVTGSVPDVRPWLWRSSVSIAPIRVARGLQNKVLEAMAAGLPVVVSPEVRAGLPEWVAKLCVCADTAEECADALLRLLDAPPQRRVTDQWSRDLDWSCQLQALPGILADAAEASREVEGVTGNTTPGRIHPQPAH